MRRVLLLAVLLAVSVAHAEPRPSPSPAPLPSHIGELDAERVLRLQAEVARKQIELQLIVERIYRAFGLTPGLDGFDPETRQIRRAARKK